MYSEAERSQQREVKKTTEKKTGEGTVTETVSKIARTRLGHVRAVFVAMFVAIVGRVLVVRHCPSWPSTGTMTNRVDHDVVLSSLLVFTTRTDLQLFFAHFDQCFGSHCKPNAYNSLMMEAVGFPLA